MSITQKQQMFVIMSGMFIAFFIILNSLPEDINFSNAIDIAGIGGKMKVLDFSFDINEFTGRRELLKRGKGTQRKAKVLVMASYNKVPISKFNKCGYLI